MSNFSNIVEARSASINYNCDANTIPILSYCLQLQ